MYFKTGATIALSNKDHIFTAELPSSLVKYSIQSPLDPSFKKMTKTGSLAKNMSFSKNKQNLFLVTESCFLQIHDADSLEKLREVSQFSSLFLTSTFALNSTDSIIAGVSKDINSFIRLYNLNKNKDTCLVKKSNIYGTNAYAIALASELRRLLYSSDTRSVFLMNFASNKKTDCKIDFFSGFVTLAQLMPLSGTILVGGWDDVLYLFDITYGRLNVLQQVSIPGQLYCMTLSPSGQFLIASGNLSQVKCYRVGIESTQTEKQI